VVKLLQDTSKWSKCAISLRCNFWLIDFVCV